MQFTKAALTILFVSSRTSAWTALSLPRSCLLAVQFHSIATDVISEKAMESFRLKFKEGDKIVSPWHDIKLSN